MYFDLYSLRNGCFDSNQFLILENVEQCGGKPEQDGTGYYVTDELNFMAPF